jgi:hypothetical protein
MIKEAAIMRKSDGKVWTGRRHNNVISKIVSEGEHSTCPRELFTQGFVTDKGEFVGRCEAHRIAIECKQIKDTKHDLFDILASEDLY